MVKRTGREGFSVLEATIALALIALAAGLAAATLPAETRFAAASLRETAARRAATSLLEQAGARRGELRPGESAVALDPVLRETLDTPRARRTVLEVEPGLLEIDVRVEWSEPGGETAHVDLVTRLAREAGR